MISVSSDADLKLLCRIVVSQLTATGYSISSRIRAFCMLINYSALSESEFNCIISRVLGTTHWAPFSKIVENMIDIIDSWEHYRIFKSQIVDHEPSSSELAILRGWLEQHR